MAAARNSGDISAQKMITGHRPVGRVGKRRRDVVKTVVLSSRDDDR
jgi:hypothetical protein